MESDRKSNPLPPKPKLAPKPGRVKVVRALYNYTAQHDDELSFEEGDLLYVFDQVSHPSWWKARSGDKSGLIPSNYVDSQMEEVKHPLHEAARRGNLSFLKECLKNGVSETGLDETESTPLYWAAHGGHIDCLKELLTLSVAPLNIKNKLGETPLHSASARNNVEVVEMLLEAGSDASIYNKYNQLPEDLTSSKAIQNLLQMARRNLKSDPSINYGYDEYDNDDDDE